MSVDTWLGIWLSNLAAVEASLAQLEAHPLHVPHLGNLLEETQRLSAVLAASPIAVSAAASASLVQTVSETLLALSRGELKKDPELFNRFAQAVRVLSEAVRRLAAGGVEPRSVIETEVSLRAWLDEARRLDSTSV